VGEGKGTSKSIGDAVSVSDEDSWNMAVVRMTASDMGIEE